MTAVRIIGIGSAHGADGAGWAAIESLQALGAAGRYPAGMVSLHRCRVPAALYPLLAGCACAILIDAVPGADGSLQLLDAAQVQKHSDLTSVHAVGIGEMLALTETLEMQPPQVTLVGIGVDSGSSAMPEQLLESLLPVLLRHIDNTVDAYLALSAGSEERV